MTARVAVVLFNLGGPDSPAAVRPFLFNLFNDPAIIGAPGPIRWMLAQLISRRRAPVAREIYETMGGSSPLLPNTKKQAEALEALMKRRWGDDREVRVFVAMRYWHPFAGTVARDVAAFGPTEVILLPLYPQFSTTTTQSSFDDWRRAARRAGVDASEAAVCCYPAEKGFVAGAAAAIRAAVKDDDGQTFRLLFSAHGLPKKIVDKGDPYQWQVEQTAAAIAGQVADRFDDWVVCYQSRVGPLEWIGPSTDEEIHRAGRDGKNLIVAPIAFVSEHSETLVELDVEYARLAAEVGVPVYRRAATVDERASFIEGLADLVDEAVGRRGTAACGGNRLCPTAWRRCAMTEAA
jgi:ferrochelatase